LTNTGIYNLHKNAGVDVGTADDEALVMWVSNKGNPVAPTSPYLQATGDVNYCWVPASGAPFTMINTAGVVSTGALQSSTLPIPADYEGWIVIPFTSFTKHTGYASTPAAVIPGGYDYLYMNATAVVYDQIGFTTDIAKFVATVEGVKTSVSHDYVGGVCSKCGHYANKEIVKVEA
jgi:hypothetical protein